ncbi:BQ2448_6691 [Microbotryum intermedium]|uniref:BQ2448_6691 protein n=1 Tax=Microbotryum intermedium TaxID=269621 RepID=A0A238FN90_9BASI|nr:BQ2448_6691 [Microbotryum intermedium]
MSTVGKKGTPYKFSSRLRRSGNSKTPTARTSLNRTRKVVAVVDNQLWGPVLKEETFIMRSKKTHQADIEQDDDIFAWRPILRVTFVIARAEAGD